MGFNEHIVPGRGALPATGDSSADRKKTLEKNAMNHMLQCLAQLVDVRAYATEIFTGLQAKAEEASARMKNVQQKVSELAKQVEPIDAQFHKMSPQCFYDAYATKKFQSETTPDGGLFIRSKAPEPVDRRRDAAHLVPELNKLDRYEKCLDVGERTNIHCLDQYTYPRFFFDQWVQGQMDLLKRKKRGKKKKKKRKRQDQPKKVTAFQKTYKDDLGREIVRKQHTVDVQVADREFSRGAAMSTVNKSYGSNKDLTYSDNRGTTGSVYQPAAYEPGKYQPEGVPATNNTTPNMSYATPEPPAGPNSPPPVQGAPPRGPPQQSYQQSPRGAPQQSYQPPQTPAAPSKPQMPEKLQKYAKMMKLRVPIPAIKNKMKADKIDLALFDQWLDPSGPKGGGTAGPPAGPPAAHGGPPRGPGGPPPGPGGPPRVPGGPPRGPGGPPGGPGGLMASIRQGAQLHQAPPQQRAPAPSGAGFLDAIRQGPALRSADERVLADRPAETNKRENMLSALRGGMSLKKASKRKLKEKIAEPEDSNNIFALMKMRELIQDSDDEEGSDDSWSSD